MIQVHQLTKRFATDEGDLLAVDGVTFRVCGSEVYGLLGPNGAGKTTTLRMVLGLLPPTSGFAEVEGHRSDDEPDAVKRCVGMVSASAGLYQWLTPREMLLYFADVYDVDPDVAEERFDQLSRHFDFAAYADRRCATLSTGQRQRVNLARALIHDPPVMLLDEPTRGLDIVGSQVIFEYIGHLRSQGKAVIVSTHRLDEAQRLCDRFGLLNRGRLMQEGSLEQLRSATGCETLSEMFIKSLSESAAAGAT